MARREKLTKGPLIWSEVVLRSRPFVNELAGPSTTLSQRIDDLCRRGGLRLIAALLALLVGAPSCAQRGAKGIVAMSSGRPVATSAGPIYMGPPVKMRVVNLTGRGVEAVWMNPNGAQENRGMVPPTAGNVVPAQFETYGSHLWIFKLDGRVIRFFAVGDQPMQDVQLGPGTATVAVAGAPVAMREANGLVVPERPSVAEFVAPPIATGPMPKELRKAPPGAEEFLMVHNAERVRLGIEPLKWSPKLSKYAEKWAKRLAKTGEFEHRSRSQARYGENLYRGDLDRTPASAARKWLAERDLYRGGAIDREDLTLIGHYTQMIWQETTHVGFGVARGPKGFVVVANYSPGGNRSREVPYTAKK